MKAVGNNKQQLIASCCYLYVLPIQGELEGVFIPLKQFLHSFFNLHAMCPTEGMEFADIDELTHRAVGLRRIEHDFTREPDCLNNQVCQLADCEFLACADIDMAIADFA